MSYTTKKTREQDAHGSAGRMMVRSLALAGAMGFGLSGVMALSGCNTTKGMGEDIESLGDSISDEADDAKN